MVNTVAYHLECNQSNNVIKEIKLVDDASDLEYLGQQLDVVVRSLPMPIVILRHKIRGLIKARLIGAAYATV